MAPEFWLRRRARIATIDTATVLVEGSVPYAESAILQNASVRKPEYLLQNEPIHTKPILRKREREEETEAQEDSVASSPTKQEERDQPVREGKRLMLSKAVRPLRLCNLLRLPYDYHSFKDFLATAGILFLGNKPTNLQKRHFGDDFERLHKAVVLRIEPKNDTDTLANQEDQAVEFSQDVRNTFWKAERNVGSNQACKLLK